MPPSVAAWRTYVERFSALTADLVKLIEAVVKASHAYYTLQQLHDRACQLEALLALQLHIWNSHRMDGEEVEGKREQDGEMKRDNPKKSRSKNSTTFKEVLKPPPTPLPPTVTVRGETTQPRSVQWQLQAASGLREMGRSRGRQAVARPGARFQRPGLSL